MNRVIQLFLCVIFISWNIQLTVSFELDKKSKSKLFYELDKNCYKAEAAVKLAILDHTHQVTVVAENIMHPKLPESVQQCIENKIAEYTEMIEGVEDLTHDCIVNARRVFTLEVQGLNRNEDILTLRKESIKLLDDCVNKAKNKVQMFVQHYNAQLSICSF